VHYAGGSASEEPPILTMEGKQMQLEGIGELIDRGTHWHLIYDQCRHYQQLAREGIEEPEQAARDILRYFAECLTCRLAARAAASKEKAA
jgi:hypothetical protein